MLFALILSVLINQAFLFAYKVGMHTRITLSAAIYQKILTLSQVTIGRLSIGHVVNLASNDVHRLDMVGCGVYRPHEHVHCMYFASFFMMLV